MSFLELYQPDLKWYITIEVTTPAQEGARHDAAKAKKLVQASHGEDWDRGF